LRANGGQTEGFERNGQLRESEGHSKPGIASVSQGGRPVTIGNKVVWGISKKKSRGKKKTICLARLTGKETEKEGEKPLRWRIKRGWALTRGEFAIDRKTTEELKKEAKTRQTLVREERSRKYHAGGSYSVGRGTADKPSSSKKIGRPFTQRVVGRLIPGSKKGGNI